MRLVMYIIPYKAFAWRAISKLGKLSFLSFINFTKLYKALSHKFYGKIKMFKNINTKHRNKFHHFYN